MKKYIYQITNKEFEVILETDDGFEWICDCGHVFSDEASFNNHACAERPHR